MPYIITQRTLLHSHWGSNGTESYIYMGCGAYPPPPYYSARFFFCVCEDFHFLSFSLYSFIHSFICFQLEMRMLCLSVRLLFLSKYLVVLHPAPVPENFLCYCLLGVYTLLPSPSLNHGCSLEHHIAIKNNNNNNKTAQQFRI